MELLLHSIKLDWPVLFTDFNLLNSGCSGCYQQISILQKKQTRRCTFHPEITERIG